MKYQYILEVLIYGLFFNADYTRTYELSKWVSSTNPTSISTPIIMLSIQCMFPQNWNLLNVSELEGIQEQYTAVQ